MMTKTKPIKLSSSALSKYCLIAGSLLLISCSSPEESAKKHLDKGYSLLKSGDNSKAMVEFKNSLQIKANSIEALYGLALAYQKIENWDKVVVLCNHILELDPNHLDANLKLFSLYMAANEMEKALDRMNALEKIAPKNPDFLAYKANYLMKSGDVAGALKIANYALSLKPNNSQALIILASDSIARQQFNEALQMIDAGIKRDPENLTLLLLQIDTLEKNQQNELAKSSLLKLIKKYPDNVDFLRHLVIQYDKKNDKKNAEKVLKVIAEKEIGKEKSVIDYLRYVNSYQGNDYALSRLDELIASNPNVVDLKFIKAGFLKQIKKIKESHAVLMDVVNSGSSLELAMKAKALLATDAFEAGNTQQGYQLIQEILKQDSRNETALLLKSAKEMQEGNFKAAIADLRVILKDAPNSGSALVALGRAHELSGEIDLADKQFKHAVDVANNENRFVLPYVEFLLRNKQADRAAAVIEPLVNAKSNDPDVLRHLAAVKMARGDLLEAEKIAKEIKAIDNQMGDQMLGAIYVNQNNFNDGIAAFQRSYSANPQSPEALLALVKALVKAERKEEAVKTLKQIIADNPQGVGPKILLAQVMIKMHDAQSAINLYQEVIQINPKLADAYLQLGEFLRDIGRLDEAMKVLKEGIANVKDNFNLNLTLAGVYELKSQFDEAIKIYAELLKTNPESEVVKNNYISLITEYKSDSHLLKNAYNLSTELKSAGSPFIQDTIGWAAYKVGKYAEAESALLSATEQAPKIAVFFYHLGMAQAELADKKKAISSLQTALKLKRNNQEIPVDLINNKLRELNQ